ncbi:hypothetical protein BBK36DRAFT_1127334 [Trichoderma citrinoviride]|uniref:Heterokaryon incompatibility domain-containing protein n=1 Tax=Trichoderma citrinoviride TaxID=58853 RepID=A0A2T4B1L1_9HYPO|nr:hypothetical protein BBK36DRAFT_1127334 [Trichoderma citrinoviride]PTB63091.1 hypothetical protein BBK36DRAFT_1127334 [Trichoderma citrinoviride]
MAGQETHPKLPDSRSIRVIKLHGAANISDEIRFDLITTSLDEPLPYEAISYTWSGQALDRPVYANGQEYRVTKNAEDVMRRLRPSKPESSRNLWIDAICINQKDDAEKSVQVQLMFEVYANAERVNIWLGPGTDAAALALKWLRWYSWTFSAAWRLQSRLASGIRSADSTFTRLLLGTATVSTSCVCACIMLVVAAVILLPFGLLPFRIGLTELASMEYWERAWTVQEANANATCFILCGSSAPLRLDLFYQSHSMVPPMFVFSALNNSRVNRRYSLHMLDTFHTNGDAELGSQIFDVLCKTRATIAKDKLFAIRAMFPDSLSELTIDYSLSDSDVYTEAARIVLEQTHTVEFFRYACQVGREDNYPSWVPSWTGLIEIPEWLCSFSPAIISEDVVIVEGEDGKVLKLKGRRVERATAAVSDSFPVVAPLPVPWSRVLDIDIAKQALAVLRKWILTTGAASPHDPQMLQLVSLISDITRIEAEEILSWFHLIWDEDNFGMEKLWDYGLNGGQVCDSRKITVNFLQLVSGRSLFMTGSGRVGMSTSMIQRDDEVALFTGEKLPYVIRKSLEHPGGHILVAPCWVSGALKGGQWPGWDGKMEEDLEDIELV